MGSHRRAVQTLNTNSWVNMRSDVSIYISWWSRTLNKEQRHEVSKGRWRCALGHGKIILELSKVGIGCIAKASPRPGAGLTACLCILPSCSLQVPSTELLVLLCLRGAATPLLNSKCQLTSLVSILIFLVYLLSLEVFLKTQVISG